MKTRIKTVTAKAKATLEDEEDSADSDDDGDENNGDGAGVLPAACLGGQTATPVPEGQRIAIGVDSDCDVSLSPPQ